MRVQQWMADGTKLFLSVVDGLDDEALDRPTRLPGWTRRHLIAHVHYNAEALRRLARWARTGEPTPMYAGAGQRASEIEHGALLPAAELRGLVRASADDLAADLAALPDECRDNEVQTAQGRTVPATEIWWMRTREVAVHAVDLDAGVQFSDLPDDLDAALAVDVVRKRCAGGEAAVLAAWLTGRTTEAPALGPWL